MTFTYPQQQDDEALVIDVLTEVMDELGEDVTVGVGVPIRWGPRSAAHLRVTADGTPTISDVFARATVRVVAYAASTSEAKRLAGLAQAVLVARYDLINAVALTGVQAPDGRDPETNAEIAMTTVQVAAVLS